MSGQKRFDFFVYTQNKSRVAKALKEGDIDYGTFSKMGFVDEFFAFLLSTDFFAFCEKTYPSPRVKTEVPPWFLLSSLLAAKMYGEESFSNIPYVLKNGSILKMLGLNIGPMPGFNNKNKKQRLYPVDQDCIRKFFKDTDPDKLTSWFNHDIVSWMAKKSAFISGLFIVDASYVPLPDNSNYKNAEYVWLDEDGNHASQDTPGARLTLCYKFSSLLNTDRDGSYYIYAGARIDPGSINGLNEGRELVDSFIASGGYTDTLLIDRGYLDGATLTHFKKDYRINWVIPLKTSMAAYDDAVGLCRAKNVDWKTYHVEGSSDGFIARKEEVTTFYDIRSWESLKVPLHVSIKKETDYESGDISYFVLAHSKKYKYPSEAFDLYKKRTKIEERHRQLKGFWNFNNFSSPAFPLVITQVIFKLAAYSLMQLYLLREDMKDLANKTISTITKKEKAGECVVILYSGSHYGVFDLDEYSFILMKLKTDAKNRLAERIKTWSNAPP
ncbi:MAG: transposase [Actinobacteria bacterium]|nr:transposase [Actinomycetota bacterium]